MLVERLSWLRRLGIAAMALTFLVMVSGAWVKGNDAGLACPDWPQCYGKWIPPFPSSETEGEIPGIQGANDDPAEGYTNAQVLYEWSHRLFVSLLLIPLVAFAYVAATTREATPALRKLPAAALLLALFQAGLGYVTVITGNPAWATVAHMATALGLMIVITVATCFAFLRPLGGPAPSKKQEPPAGPRQVSYVYPETEIEPVSSSYPRGDGRNG